MAVGSPSEAPPTRAVGPEPAPPATPRLPPPPNRMWVWVLVAAAILVAAGIVGWAYYDGSGTMNVTVDSTHLTSTVNVSVYVGGSLVVTEPLAPGGSIHLSHKVFVGTGCRSVTAVASSTGGGLGPQSDSATRSLCPSGSAGVTLFV
jgi:hypothetical protein